MGAVESASGAGAVGGAWDSGPVRVIEIEEVLARRSRAVCLARACVSGRSGRRKEHARGLSCRTALAGLARSEVGGLGNRCGRS